MKTTKPEPGFVQAYRLFMVIRILFWLAVGPVLILLKMAGGLSQPGGPAARDALIRQLSLPNILPLLAVEVLLMGLLLWNEAPRRLRGWFVPLTMALGVLPLLIGYYWWPAENPLQSPFVMFFFVTAVLIAWEYNYHTVTLYVLGLVVYEGLMSPTPASVPLTVPLSWLVLQGVMMLLAGYVTATLATVQREQRAALAQAYQRQAAVNERLQLYAATLEELTISRERNRLARELHDTLAHSLSALTVQMEAVRSLWGTQPDKARRILDQADETARTGLAEARRALQALRASPLADLGLLAALRELAEETARRTGAALDLQLPDQLIGCPSPAAEQGLYRVAQETLENVARHAGARNVRVCLAEARDRLALTIEDDGRGIEPGVMAAAGTNGGEHFGIRGMQERARLIGGELQITGAEGQGTRVALTVPLERQADGAGPDL